MPEWAPVLPQRPVPEYKSPGSDEVGLEDGQ